MDFVWERAAHGGRLFLVAFEHTDGALPRVRRGSRACLFTVNLDALFRLAPASAPVTLPSAALSWVDEVLFDTGDSWCQMNGGASIYLDDDHRLLVYGVPHRLLPFDDPPSATSRHSVAWSSRPLTSTRRVGRKRSGWGGARAPGYGNDT